MLRDYGKGFVYSVFISFGVIVSFHFSIIIVKGIPGAFATGHNKKIQINPKLN